MNLFKKKNEKALVEKIKALYEMDVITPEIEEKLKEFLAKEILVEEKETIIEVEEKIKEEPTNKDYNMSDVKEPDYALDIKEFWNKRGRLPKIRKLNLSRNKKIKTRVNNNGIEEVKRAIEKLNDSDFCTGKNNRNWKADFDWLFKNDNNISKVLEGKYDNKPSQSNVKYKKTIKKKTELKDIKEMFYPSSLLSYNYYFDNEFLTLALCRSYGYNDLLDISKDIGVAKQLLKNWIVGKHNPIIENSLLLLNKLGVEKFRLIYKKTKLPEMKTRLYYTKNEKTSNLFSFDFKFFQDVIRKYNISIKEISTYTNADRKTIEEWIYGESVPTQNDFYKLSTFLQDMYKIYPFELNKKTTDDIASSQELIL